VKHYPEANRILKEALKMVEDSPPDYKEKVVQSLQFLQRQICKTAHEFAKEELKTN
jgi:predicted metal-dependent hydrolase